MEKLFPLTAELKIKNGYLAAAVEKLGSQSAVARHLDLWTSDFGRWCNLQGGPPAKPTKHWPRERLDELEKSYLILPEHFSAISSQTNSGNDSGAMMGR